MATYRLPAESPYTKPFRVFAAFAVASLLFILFVSIYDPPGLSDAGRHLIGWAAVAILGVAISASSVMAVKSGLWKLRKTYLVELSDGKLTQTRPGWPTLQIPLVQIESMRLGNGWLIVNGGEPKRRILVPAAVEDFDVLQRELSAYGTIIPIRPRERLLSFVPLIVGIAAYLLLLTSHKPSLVIAAGVAAVLFQADALLIFWRMWRAKKVSDLVMVSLALASVGILWLVFVRVKAAL